MLAVEQKPEVRESRSQAPSAKWGIAPRVLEASPVTQSTEADEYDAMVQRHAWLFRRPFVKLVSRLGPDSARVLDIGTGPGWVPIDLANLHPRWQFCALDISADMLARARQHAVQAGVAGRFQFVPGSATSLPFPDGEFDLVISHFTLHHVERPEEFIREAARVARPGGRLIVKDLVRQPRWKAALLLAFSKYVMGYSPLQLRMYQESLAAALLRREVEALARNSALASASVRGFMGLDVVLTAQVPEPAKESGRNPESAALLQPQ